MEIKDDFAVLLEKMIEKIRHDDEYLSFMIANMAAIVEHSDDAIIGIDNDGTILSWNKGAKKMYGYHAEEAIGKNISILIPTHKHGELGCIMDRVNENQLICNFETVREGKNGKNIPVSVTISPIKNSKDEIIGASTIERDISKQKEAEEALKRSEEKYRRLFNDDLTGDFIASLDGKILECNPAFAEIYGFNAPEEAFNWDISKINPSGWKSLIKALKSKGKIKGHKTIHKRVDGEKIGVIANLVAINDEFGRFSQIKGYIFDIGEA